jgi:hypothetical protein
MSGRGVPKTHILKLPNKVGKSYDIEKDAPFWLVWEVVEQELTEMVKPK